MTDKTVRFRHSFREGDWTWYAYDGAVEVVDGVLSIPEGFEHWMTRAWITGFRKHPDTGEFITDLGEHIAAELARDPGDSAESAEETTDEGPADRGQSPRKHRVRKSEPASGEGVPV